MHATSSRVRFDHEFTLRPMHGNAGFERALLRHFHEQGGKAHRVCTAATTRTASSTVHCAGPPSTTTATSRTSTWKRPRPWSAISTT